jgi:pimeloyl-ACP methyl ester carboxylesterase
MWDDFSKRTLPNGCVLLSDVNPMTDRQVIIVPGRGTAFRSRDQLEFYRRHSIRIHVFYYENHTFASHDSTLEGDISSFENSILDLHTAIRDVDATAIVGYSLGGLVTSLYMHQYETSTSIRSVILLSPYISPHSVVRYAPREIFPTFSQRSVMNTAVHATLFSDDYYRWRFPLREEPHNNSEFISINMLKLCERTLRDIVPVCNVMVRTLLLSAKYDNILSSATVEKNAKRMFKNLYIRQLELDHYIWPCVMSDDEDLVRSHIIQFLE